jgi:hypothetical protein
MKKIRIFIYATVAAIAFIACDWGTADWPTETPKEVYSSSLKVQWDGAAGAIRLEWEGVENARGYEVFRYADGADSPDMTVSRGTDTVYLDSKIEAGHTYAYKVRAYNGAGWGGMDSTASRGCKVPPSKTQGVKAKGLTSKEIEVSWDAVIGATDFYIYRSQNSDFTKDTCVEVVVGSVLQYVDKGLKANTIYYYKIEASNDGGKGAKSDVASAKTKLAPPAWVFVEILPSDEVKISWAPVAGAAGYEVFYESGLTNATFDFPIDIGKVAKFETSAAKDTLWTKDLGFTEYGLMKGTEIYYKVCAVETFYDGDSDKINASGKPTNYTKNYTGDMSEIGAKDGDGFAEKK